MTTLFLAWQNASTRRWFPIGRLTQEAGDVYRFAYVRGVRAAQEEGGFEPLVDFPDLNATYESERLFPLFANRVMPASRPDFAEYIAWLRLEGQEKDPLAFLARTEGRRQTDSLEVFPAATPVDGGGWRVPFFVHGLRHVSPEADTRAQSLESGERLLMGQELQNPVDPNALTLRTYGKPSGDATLLGYVPRYLATEALPALQSTPASIEARVVSIAPPPAPSQYRVLAELVFDSTLPQPFSSSDFQPQ